MHRIKTISTIRDSAPDDLFITCESFEDRCIGAVSLLGNYQTKACLIVSFLSRLRNPRGESKRRKNMTDMLRILSDNNIGAKPIRIKVDPYNPLDLLLSLRSELAEAGVDVSDASITIDISCFTKIQLLFLLTFIQRHVGRGAMRLLYTLPSYYGSLDRRDLAIGYDRLMIAPFANSKPRELTNRGLAMIMLLGHEGSRAMHAWSEMEPESTTLVKATSLGDPEPVNIAERQNQTLLSKAREGQNDFTLRTCPDRGLSQGIELFRTITAGYTTKPVERIAFVPMGPKPLVAAFALSTYNNGNAPIDIVYPVPQAYDSGYSVGIGSTYSYVWNGR